MTKPDLEIQWAAEVMGDPIAWLMEPDSPGVRYLAMRDLLDFPEDDPEYLAARRAAHEQGPIAKILDQMETGGYWVEPGPGYYPKYRGSVWSLITLAQLGAHADMDERIQKACAHILAHSLTDSGQFSIKGTPSGTVDCLQGNLCMTLIALGCDDPVLEKAFEWMARTVTGEGIAPVTEKKAPVRYYAGKCGPNFACGANNNLPCAWGAAKVMAAFGILPDDKRTPLIERAIAQGVAFLLATDPARAEYPSGWRDKPSRNWWKFGFPLFYITDLLQIVEALVSLGYRRDPRLANALQYIVNGQDQHGRWDLAYDYRGKIWVDFGEKNKPNKWVTLRALRVLRETDSG